jgi:hypothetical protein
MPLFSDARVHIYTSYVSIGTCNNQTVKVFPPNLASIPPPSQSHSKFQKNPLLHSLIYASRNRPTKTEHVHPNTRTPRGAFDVSIDDVMGFLLSWVIKKKKEPIGWL